MTTMMRAAGLAILAAAALTACGGGGGGDGGDPLPAGAAVALSAANYESVAQKTLTATAFLTDSSGLVLGAQVAPGGQAVLAWTRAQLRHLPGLLARAPKVVTGAISSEVMNCSGGGSVNVQLNDANGNEQLDAGDSASFDASNCVEAGVTISGGIGMVINTASGDLDGTAYNATVAVTLTGLRVATAAGGATGSGSMQLAVSSTDAETYAVEITVSSMTMSGLFAGVNDTITLQNWQSTSRTARSNGVLRTSISASGTTISSVLGSVVVATVQPMVQDEGADYPASGRITATGANGSLLQITALNSSDVLLELDADGNGVFETRSTKAWSDLI